MRKRFVVGEEPDIVERCAKHITGLLNLYVHKPVIGFAWKRYFEDALAALDPSTRKSIQAAWQFKANARRWENY